MSKTLKEQIEAITELVELDLQGQIEKYESDGWQYEHEFKVHVQGNTLMQCMALVKGNKYRMIKAGKIYGEENIMSDEDYEQMQSCEQTKRLKLTRSGRDVAQGYDNLYNVKYDDSGEWEVVSELTRPHNCTSILCDFKIIAKGNTYMLLGTGANSTSWIGREIDIEKVNSMSMNAMAEYLEA